MPLISPLMPIPHHAAPLSIQCEIFDTRSQDVVDVCLEMFNCVPAEQTVAIRMAKFLKRVNNSNNILCQTFAVEAAKELATL